MWWFYNFYSKKQGQTQWTTKEVFHCCYFMYFSDALLSVHPHAHLGVASPGTRCFAERLLGQALITPTGNTPEFTSYPAGPDLHKQTTECFFTHKIMWEMFSKFTLPVSKSCVVSLLYFLCKVIFFSQCARQNEVSCEIQQRVSLSKRVVIHANNLMLYIKPYKLSALLLFGK